MAKDQIGRKGRKADSPLVMVHIPKCAGASFWLTVVRSLPSSVPRYPRSTNTLAVGCGTAVGSHHCSVRELEACAERAGPVAVAVPRWLPAGEVRYVTVVREPVARVVSEYMWAVTEKRGKLRNGFHGQFDWRRETWDALPTQDPSRFFRAWVLDGANTAHNRMSRMLAAPRQPQHARARGPRGGAVYAEGRCAATNESKAWADAAELYGAEALKRRGFARCVAEDRGLAERAVATVETRLFFVALTEALETALPCLAAKLGLEGRAMHAAALQTIHASTKGKDHAASLRVSDATKDGIRARNAADTRVYDAARRRFARDCAHHSRSPQVRSSSSLSSRPRSSPRSPP